MPRAEGTGQTQVQPRFSCVGRSLEWDTFDSLTEVTDGLR